MQKLKVLIENGKWFHAIKFSKDLKSDGRFKNNRPQNYSLYGTLHYLEHIDLNDKTCLDIGTMDGLTAFTLKDKGAKRVIATDLSPRDTFLEGKAYLNHDIEYHPSTSIEELPSVLQGDKLDVMACAGILYHVFDPLTMLMHCRKHMKENGLLILETQYMPHSNKPTLVFSPVDKWFGSKYANTFLDLRIKHL